MGYRSDVALGIAFPNKAALITFVSAQRITGDNHMQEAIKQYRVTHMSCGFGEGVVLWVSYEDAEWDPLYEYVRAHEQIIANAKLLDYSTIFVEIGEEINDIKFEVDHKDKSDGEVLYECFNISRRVIQPNTSEDIASFVKEN
jgi:hypothetical protein